MTFESTDVKREMLEEHGYRLGIDLETFKSSA